MLRRVTIEKGKVPVTFLFVLTWELQLKMGIILLQSGKLVKNLVDRFSIK